jgi:hypothetical protein
VGTALPGAQAAGQFSRLQDGQEVLLSESASSSGGFIYVLARPNPGRLRNYSSTFSLWIVVCTILLAAGMIAVRMRNHDIDMIIQSKILII